VSDPPESGGRLLRRGLQFIGRYARAHPVPLTIAIAGSTLYALMSVLGAIVLGRVTDEVVTPAFQTGVDTADLWMAGAAIMGVAVLRSLGVVARRYFAGMTNRRMQVTWRNRLADTYLGMPLSRLRQLPTGELLAHADNDVVVSTEAISPLPFAIGVVVLVVFATISLATVDVWFLLVALVLFPAVTWMSHVYSQRVVGPATTVQERVAEVSAIVHESVDGALVVKTLGLESDEEARLGAAAEQLRAARVRFGNMRAVFEPLLDSVPTLGSIILLALGAWRVSTDTLTTGQVVQALALFQLLAFPMRVLGYFLEELPHSLVAAERLDRITAEPLAEPPEVPTPLPPGPLGVAVDGVRLSFDDHVVLRDITMLIAPGEVVALVGATGSGKSTLAWLIAGLTAGEAGVVRIGGVPVDEIEPGELSDAVAMVFQEAFLFADELRTNIDVEAALDEHRVISAAQVAQAHEFISALPGGYATLVGERGVTLSGGQRQRTALARALVRRPRVLLLDDATSAVDPVVEEAILTALRGELDMTALIVAHRLSTIALADRVFFLDGGRIAAEGEHTELLATVPGYARLVRAYEEQEAHR